MISGPQDTSAPPRRELGLAAAVRVVVVMVAAAVMVADEVF